MKPEIKTSLWVTFKFILTLLLILASLYAFLISFVMLFSGAWGVTVFLALFVIPLAIPLIWLEKKTKYLIFYMCYILLFFALFVTQVAIEEYEDSITINTTPNINVNEYLPFDEGSKIVKLDDASLTLSGELPILDGATAAFPVYSAFIHALYPESTELGDGVFEYNNTVGGYRALAEKKTDIFFGAAPSKEQNEYAIECGTEFEYTQVAYEAFVFFVHKDNPIESLTSEQIRKIYSGEIKNWSEVGGKNEKIVPYQRNEGSGSQSMFLRFMGGVTPMEPDKDEEIGGMGDIISKVADYRSVPSSIGFSFRYYVEGIIKNPDIKLIAVDGTAPTVENIKNGSYPIIAPVYAVTYKGNDNPNVPLLLDWILSDEGQYIIEETGYVGYSK